MECHHDTPIIRTSGHFQLIGIIKKMHYEWDSPLNETMISYRFIPVVKNMFRFHDALDHSFHLAGLRFPGEPYPRAFQPGPLP
jgi:hypothetical protein